MLHVVTTPSLALLTSVTTAPSEYSDRSTADTRDVALYTAKKYLLQELFHNASFREAHNIRCLVA
jgi:hypothetical protein